MTGFYNEYLKQKKYMDSREENVKQVLSSLFIETADNGFIVYENSNLCSASVSNRRKVFNTKDQLKDYIDDNF